MNAVAKELEKKITATEMFRCRVCDTQHTPSDGVIKKRVVEKRDELGMLLPADLWQVYLDCPVCGSEVHDTYQDNTTIALRQKSDRAMMILWQIAVQATKNEEFPKSTEAVRKFVKSQGQNKPLHKLWREYKTSLHELRQKQSLLNGRLERALKPPTVVQVKTRLAASPPVPA